MMIIDCGRQEDDHDDEACRHAVKNLTDRHGPAKKVTPHPIIYLSLHYVGHGNLPTHSSSCSGDMITVLWGYE